VTTHTATACPVDHPTAEAPSIGAAAHRCHWTIVAYLARAAAAPGRPAGTVTIEACGGCQARRTRRRPVGWHPLGLPARRP
jgi:hypothetical protein